MLLRECAIEWRFVILPLLTNVCALLGNMNPTNYVFSVMQTSQKRYWFGFNDFLWIIRSYY